MFDASFWFFSILLVVAVGSSLFMTSKQLNSINKLRKTCRDQYPYASLGKGTVKNVSVFLLICADENLDIVKSYRMKGFTVFDRMKEFDQLNGLNVRNIQSEADLPESMNRRTKLAAVNACSYILEALQKGSESSTEELSAVSE